MGDLKPPRSRRRWGDDDRQFGPFTYSRDTLSKPLGVVLDSGEDEHPGCHLRLRGFGHTLIVELPPIIGPWRQKIIAESWDAATVARMGQNWYWDESRREYGFQFSDDGFLQVFLGRQTDDSSTEQRWSYFLPWMQWRFVRHSWYGLSGELLRTDWEANSFELRRRQMESATEFRQNVPKASFYFHDFDGEKIEATTFIEEREWRFGTGWFKWLSLFRKAKVRRSLDIWFSAEVGQRKGSWKGGLRGHGIEMLPGELHEAAFRRYCAENGLAFVAPPQGEHP